MDTGYLPFVFKGVGLNLPSFDESLEQQPKKGVKMHQEMLYNEIDEGGVVFELGEVTLETLRQKNGRRRSRVINGGTTPRGEVYREGRVIDIDPDTPVLLPPQ